MESFAVTSTGAEQTQAMAAVLARRLRPGDVVILTGGLAAGKTTFVKGIASTLGSPNTATSPTFTLANFYPARAGTILHIDAYRLSGIYEYRDLGLDEYVGESITVVEWGEKIAEDFPCHLTVELACETESPDLRVLRFGSGCSRWGPVLRDLQAELLDEARLS
jgi:tRNA threonylcarbamoyladenosine biosynthesis protein TsaE